MGVYNVKIKEYAHSTKIMKYSKPIFYDKKKSSTEDAAFLDDDTEEDLPEQEEEKVASEQTPEQAAHSLQVSLNRTKNMIYDLAKSNNWDWFITFTFDPNRVDSTDYDVVVKMLKRFIDNMRKNYAPNLVYLIVPELHADGKKFHFHGLLAKVQWMEFKPSGITDADGEMIYNVLRWKYGFSTASKIKDTVRASAYITKYITKDCVQVTKHKRRYFASKNIKRPVEQKLNTDLGLIDIIQTYKPDFMKSTVVEAAHQKVTYLEIDDKLAEDWIRFKEEGKYNFPEYTTGWELYECKVFYEKTGETLTEDWLWNGSVMAWKSVEKADVNKGIGDIILYRKKK